MKVGDKVIVDGIPCTVFMFYNGEYYAVDDHGLSYYAYGIDEQNISVISNDDPEYKLQWGAYNNSIDEFPEELGAGLSNSNSIITIPEALITYSTSNSPMTIWQALKDLREDRNSNRWFIGSKDELLAMFLNIDVPNTYDYLYSDIGDVYISWTSSCSTSKSQAECVRYYSGPQNNAGLDYIFPYRYQGIFCRVLTTFTEDEITGGDVTISHERNSTEIRYTDTGEDPTENSSLYSSPISVDDNDEIKARAFEEFFIQSDVNEIHVDLAMPPLTTSIPIGTELNDGIVVYDKGEKYGNYSIYNGELIKLSKYINSGTEVDENDKFRFLIAAKEDFLLNGQNLMPISVDGITLDDANEQDIGYGIINTDIHFGSYYIYKDSLWRNIFDLNKESGRNWFVPSLEEAYCLYSIKDNISSGKYWTSSEYSNSIYYWLVDAKNESADFLIGYNSTNRVRLMYRV